MLHGCTQTSEAFAVSTRMNQIAAKEGFAVLYPEQNHLAIAPGMAQSLAGALKAMRGQGVATPLSALATGTHLPALLVSQGSADPLVAAPARPAATPPVRMRRA